ncbi:hypothetical protein [Alkalicoccus urumqiensis]|uniref:Uncharacterized protein n=1 Tax=Alkalicoccus urumqiensis TaxID=1548213 RepID=A0A2P6MF02_ALKUR|nr:hypothetical protein [Alkalicoccus urumqiensis]PRO64843.1 hypothetical protein C6I21_13110 [Alkalicoccus urumqiensis]
MITITKFEEEENKLTAKPDVTLPFQGLTPESHMLVDSDGGAFVYLLAHQEEFIHLRFEDHLWETLNTYRESEPAVFVKTGLSEVELTAFWEELSFLLDNIVGNHNYGKEFVESVERTFHLQTEED